MIRALFFDIDGTLVSFKTHQIPVSTVSAIAEAKARGVQIFISTGRPKVLITNLKALEEQNLIDGYITMNGAYCFAGDTVISKQPISPHSVEIITRYANERQIPNLVVGEHDICICDSAEIFEELFYHKLEVDVQVEESTVREVIASKREIFQLTTFITENQEDELQPLVPDCEMGRWHPAFVDITSKGCTKQQGIDEIIRYFGISIDETMSFGDGGNDISMLRHAHIGVAMGNALDSVKAVSDYITDSVDNDGIAKALRHYGIID
ncbi:MAG: Cof-type HAD-IIB family hydrolase [Bacteroidaceae bacterium]|nr:Cof-type HAD-IIB family hydrolase [Bacteroidaceae bacterium]